MCDTSCVYDPLIYVSSKAQRSLLNYYHCIWFSIRIILFFLSQQFGARSQSDCSLQAVMKTEVIREERRHLGL